MMNVTIMGTFAHREDTMARVGVAELKSGLSQYLDRVQAGETVIVTDHGRPVAKLIPMALGEQEPDDRLRALERLGWVRLGDRPISSDFWKLPRPQDASGRSLELLLEEREDGR